MTSPSYAEIIVPLTKDEQLSTLLTLAVIADFPTTSWHPGSVPLALLDIEAQSFAEQSKTIAAIAKGGVLEDADEDWLPLLVLNEYNLTRRAAIFTKGTAVLSCVATAGPYTIDANQLWASDASDHRFNNLTGGVLASGGTLSLLWQAEFAGSAHNLAQNTLNRLKTALPGVTINNPSVGWKTQVGTDIETPAALRQRAKDRWPDIGSGATAAVYRLWAISAQDTDPAAAGVTRTKVLEASNLGTTAGGHVTVYLAGDSGAVDGPVAAAVAAYIETKRPLCVIVHVAPATDHVVEVTGTLYVSPGYGATALGLAQTNLAALQAATDIGGTVYRDGVIEVLMAVPGATHAPLSLPAADVVLDDDEVVSFDIDLTIIEA